MKKKRRKKCLFCVRTNMKEQMITFHVAFSLSHVTMSRRQRSLKRHMIYSHVRERTQLLDGYRWL